MKNALAMRQNFRRVEGYKSPPIGNEQHLVEPVPERGIIRTNPQDAGALALHRNNKILHTLVVKIEDNGFSLIGLGFDSNAFIVRFYGRRGSSENIGAKRV